MTAEAHGDARMALITPTTTYDGFDQADIVVEAVFEDMDLKKTTFAELDARHEARRASWPRTPRRSTSTRSPRASGRPAR